MKFLKATFAGGLLFLVPVVIVAIILEKALALVRKIVEPLAEKLPNESVIGLRPAMLLAIAALVLLCFFAGVFARTKLARRVVGWLEGTVLSNLPGYEFFKGMGEDLLGMENQAQQQVVLAHLDDAWKLGFLIERLDNGMLAVFVPEAPNPHSGEVCFVALENVKFLENVHAPAVQKCLKRLGAGASQIMMEQVHAKVPPTSSSDTDGRAF